MVSWACLAMSLMGFFITRAVFRQRTDLAVYLGCFGLGAYLFFCDACQKRPHLAR